MTLPSVTCSQTCTSNWLKLQHTHTHTQTLLVCSYKCGFMQAFASSCRVVELSSSQNYIALGGRHSFGTKLRINGWKLHNLPGRICDKVVFEWRIWNRCALFKAAFGVKILCCNFPILLNAFKFYYQNIKVYILFRKLGVMYILFWQCFNSCSITLRKFSFWLLLFYFTIYF